MFQRVKNPNHLDFILVFFLAFISSTLFADSSFLTEAEKFENQGKTTRAYELYKEWLQDYSQDKLFTVLLKFQDMETNPRGLRYYYETYVEKLSEPLEKSRIYHDLGQLNQLMGDYEKAATCFMKASGLSTGDDKYKELLMALGIYYQLGFYSELAGQLESIVSENADIITGKLILQIKLFQIQEEKTQIQNLITRLPQNLTQSKYYPQFLLTLFEFYYFSDQKDQANKILIALKKYYFQSVEYFLAEQIFNSKEPDKYHYHLIPADIFNSKEIIAQPVEEKGPPEVKQDAEKKPQNKNAEVDMDKAVSQVSENNEKTEEKKQNSPKVYVQVGSYLDKDNAIEQLAVLKKAGFMGLIVEKNISSKIYHRLLVTIPESAHDKKAFIQLLKDKGFQGFLYYGE
ncbi:MAG: SPOR domain-containing protein [Spirochaetales bacterium]|nr:SPOR domain-containing protein [Spirochaetales bacterium]